MGLSLLFDLLDGAVARALNVSSEIGLQLDSLADMVSFGAVPGFILYHLLGESIGLMAKISPIPFTGFVVTLFAALRLAKFNVTSSEIKDFIGLSTPPATVFVVGLLFWKSHLSMTSLSIIAGLVAALMVAPIPMFSVKGRKMQLKGNELLILLVLVSIVLLITMRLKALSILVILYVILSMLDNTINKKWNLKPI